MGDRQSVSQSSAVSHTEIERDRDFLWYDISVPVPVSNIYLHRNSFGKLILCGFSPIDMVYTLLFSKYHSKFNNIYFKRRQFTDDFPIRSKHICNLWNLYVSIVSQSRMRSCQEWTWRRFVTSVIRSYLLIREVCVLFVFVCSALSLFLY